MALWASIWVYRNSVFLAVNCLKLHRHLFPIGLPIPNHRMMWLLRHIMIAHKLNLPAYPRARFLLCHRIVKSLQKFTVGFKEHRERGSLSHTATSLYFLTASNTGRKPLTSEKGKADVWEAAQHHLVNLETTEPKELPPNKGLPAVGDRGTAPVTWPK